MTGGPLGKQDLRRLEAHGVALEDAEHQLELLSRPRKYSALVRACTVGDGIVRLSAGEAAELHEFHERAAAAGRLTKFVPASGAATRMFKELSYFLTGPGRSVSWDQLREQAAAGQAEAAALREFLDNLERFAFHADLGRVFDRRDRALAGARNMDEAREIIEGLLSAEGLNYLGLPKGLLAFHVYGDGARTAFEEQLAEAAGYVRDGEGQSRLHLTVSPGHEELFRERFETIRPLLRKRHDAEFDISYSTQSSSTNTLAVDPDNRPFRDGAGELLFRPGGHGALIENLDQLRADLVYVKNIDNVQPEWNRRDTLEWKKTLAGYLVRVQGEIFEMLRRLKRDSSMATLRRGEDFLLQRLGQFAELDDASADRLRDALLERLDRPVRVCGVVRNTGEPGGGPFWVVDDTGRVSRQLVETAQVDPHDEEQQAILRGSTHFSPVDLVCGVRDVSGEPFDLHGFVDTDAVLVAEKSFEGRPLKALERPGLWNGAMARWITVFVEVPLSTFTPVKSVLDLLRPEHQPGS